LLFKETSPVTDNLPEKIAFPLKLAPAALAKP
jgi:hypothetical protein